MTTSPTAGSAAANQYGVFQVRYPSAKQQAFVASLAARKDVVAAQLATEVAMCAAGTLNLKATSRLIDDLQALPDVIARPTGRGPRPARPATEKQVAFVKDLASNRVWRDADMLVTTFPKGNNVGIWATLMITNDCVDEVTPGEASEAIDYLKTCPKLDVRGAAADGRTGEVERGMYRDAEGTIYRVYLGQQSGRNLVKRLVETGDTWVDSRGQTKPVYEYEYVGLAASKLPATATLLPLEEAKAWGSMTSSCCVCAARLDDPESVDAGIGPVCGRKYR